MCVFSPGCARSRKGDDVTAQRERRVDECVQRRNGRGWMTEQPASRDDWDTIVEYNEKVLRQQNLNVFANTSARLQRVKVSSQQNEIADVRVCISATSTPVILILN